MKNSHKNNFDKDGTHLVTHTLFNPAGFNKDGFKKDGLDKLGKKK